MHTHQSDESTADSTKTETTPSDPLLAMVHQSIHPSDDEASDNHQGSFSPKDPDRFRSVNIISFNMPTTPTISLVDRGANGGLAGSDMRVIYKTHRKINISGIDNHEVNGLDVVTGCNPPQHLSWKKSLASSMNMPTLGKDHPSIHQDNLNGSRPMLMKSLSKLVVPNFITTLDGYSVPSPHQGWFGPMPPPLEDPQNHNMDSYPHVFFTSPDEWDPSVLDHDPPPLDGLDPQSNA